MLSRSLRSVAHVRPLTFSTVRWKSDHAGVARDGSNESTSEPSEDRQKHIESLNKYYPPSLIKSILAAEASVTPEQWAGRKINDQNQFAPLYDDDFAHYHPLYDFPKHEWIDKSQPWQPIPQRLPPGVSVISDSSQDMANGVNLAEMEQLSGLSKEFLRTLVSKNLITKKVVNMTRKGKQYGFYCLTVVGDKNGHVAIGEGRDATVASLATSRAIWNGIKNLQYVPRFEDRTIFGTVNHKFGSVLVELSSAPPGSGLKVNHIVYEICRACGIKDLAGHVRRSRNPMNVAKATVQALTEKQQSADQIAASRGKRVVDVTSTYYNF